MKNRRTDPLNPTPGNVVNIRGNAVTAEFDNGTIFTRDKSHFKIIDCDRNEKNYHEKIGIDCEQKIEEPVKTCDIETKIDSTNRKPIYVSSRGRNVYKPDRFTSE